MRFAVAVIDRVMAARLHAVNGKWEKKRPTEEGLGVCTTLNVAVYGVRVISGLGARHLLVVLPVLLELVTSDLKRCSVAKPVYYN